MRSADCIFSSWMVCLAGGSLLACLLSPAIGLTGLAVTCAIARMMYLD